MTIEKQPVNIFDDWGVNLVNSLGNVSVRLIIDSEKLYQWSKKQLKDGLWNTSSFDLFLFCFYFSVKQLYLPAGSLPYTVTPCGLHIQSALKFRNRKRLMTYLTPYPTRRYSRIFLAAD